MTWNPIRRCATCRAGAALANSDECLSCWRTWFAAVVARGDIARKAKA